MAKFNVTDILNQKSKAEVTEETARFVIRDIPIAKIKPSADNQYGMRDIEDLAANIESLGLLHNLVVKSEDSDGFYEIISGERRYRACNLLLENGNDKFRYLPCKVEKAEPDEVSELKLIYANATSRELNDWERTTQATRIKELLYKLKESGYTFTGRMNEIAAEILSVSPAQVKRMEKINKDLSDEFKEELKAGNVGITAAYEISTLNEEEQINALKELKETGQIDVQAHKRRRTKQDGPTKEQRNVTTLFERAGINLYSDDGKLRDPAELGRDIYKFLGILD
jgi:ParB family chromosome partitioning protein